MKIALEFSGSLRTFSFCFSSFYDKIIRRYDCDIFMYSPNEIEAEQKIKDLRKLKNIKIIKLFNEIDLDEKDYQNHLSPEVKGCQRVLRLLTYLKEVNNLKVQYEKENNFVYDWVFRCRCDTKILNNLGDLNQLNSNFIYIPNHDHWNGVNDRFAFGSSFLMNIYNNRIDLLDEFICKGGILHSETFLRSVLIKKNICIFPTSVQVQIIRKNGAKILHLNNGLFPKIESNNGKWKFFRKLDNHKKLIRSEWDE